MDPTRRGLLDKVLADPGDDEPRLVYADWLISQAEPRGDFISIQIHLRGSLSPARRQEYRGREQALLREHGAEWSAPAAFARLRAFSRGFIDRITSSAADFLSAHAALFALEPVRAVELVDVDRASVEELVRAGCLERITSLALRGDVGDDGTRALAGCPDLRNLVNLNLNSAGVGPDGAAALAASPHLAGLEALTLSGNDIGPKGLEALAGSEHLALERLFVAGCELDDTSVEALARSPAMARLSRLGLNRNYDLTGTAAEALLTSPQLAHLAKCELSSISVEGELKQKLAARWGQSF